MTNDNALVQRGENKPLTAKVVGVGNAGLKALVQVASSDVRDIPGLAVHTNVRAIEACPVAEKILIGQTLVHGLGTGADPALGKAAAEEDAALIMEQCGGTDLVFLIAGLGGGTGTGASGTVARLAKESGALVIAMVTLPFKFEGSRRQEQAQLGLQQLRAEADVVISLPNQKLFKLIDEKTSALEAFQISNELLVQGIGGIWRMLTRPGLINLDFGDLSSTVRGRQVESALAMARAEGEHRAREVVDVLVQSPLIDGGQSLVEADSLLVSCVGGPDLTMTEIDKVMEQLGRHAERAQIMMGAAIDDSLQGKLEVTVIACRRHSREERAGRFESGVGSEILSANSLGIENDFLNPGIAQRPPSRFVPPPPEFTREKAQQVLGQQGKARKAAAKLLQGQLPLEIVSKGRFEKSEPTVHRGQDLDVPTYIRRGIPLN